MVVGNETPCNGVLGNGVMGNGVLGKWALGNEGGG